MTANEMANKLATEAATEIDTHYYSPTITASKICILSTIPLKEMLDAIEALRELLETSSVISTSETDECFVDLQCLTPEYDDAYNTLIAIDAKLKGAK